MSFRSYTLANRLALNSTKIQSISSRAIHTVPKLPYDAVWSKNGIPSLYSKQGYEVAWKEYQTYLATNLTLLTSGTDLEQQNAFHTMLTTSGVNYRASTFHYASQLHNNHFFFSALAENPAQNTSVPSRELAKRINASFGTFEDFKAQFIAKAKTLTNNGWVFVNENEDKSLQIKVLNNEGSPYFYNRNQSTNLSAPIELSEYSQLKQHETDLKNQVKDWSLPLLGVSLWDYAFLHDYGVERKEEYLENVWKAIDWDVINKRVFVVS